MFFSANQTFPHVGNSDTNGIAYNSLVALPDGKLWSLAGTYDNSHEMSQIYQLDFSTGFGKAWEAVTPLSRARSGKFATLLPSEYLCCEGDSSCN